MQFRLTVLAGVMMAIAVNVNADSHGDDVGEPVNLNGGQSVTELEALLGQFKMNYENQCNNRHRRAPVPNDFNMTGINLDNLPAIFGDNFDSSVTYTVDASSGNIVSAGEGGSVTTYNADGTVAHLDYPDTRSDEELELQRMCEAMWDEIGPLEAAVLAAGGCVNFGFVESTQTYEPNCLVPSGAQTTKAMCAVTAAAVAIAVTMV